MLMQASKPESDAQPAIAAKAEPERPSAPSPAKADKDAAAPSGGAAKANGPVDGDQVGAAQVQTTKTFQGYHDIVNLWSHCSRSAL